MPYFTYKAVDEEGNIKEGLIESIDEFECIRVLKEKELQPLNIQRKSYFFFKKPEDDDEIFLGRSVLKRKAEKKEKGKRVKETIGSRLRFTQSISYDEFVIFLREFATLITAGVNILPAVELLAMHSGDVHIRRGLSKVVQNLHAGYPMHVAFAKDVKIFPLVFISMINAGVISGNLPKILTELADYYEKEQKVKKKFIASLTYPIAVFIVAVSGVFFLVNYIFPDFIKIFKQLNIKLPLPTKILITTVEVFRQPVTILTTIALIVVVSFALYSYLKTPFGRYQFDWFKIRIPIVGDIIKKIMLCRFCRTLGILYENGINLSYALDITCDVIDNRYYQDEIRRAKDEILHTGMQMHKIIAANKKTFPPVFAQFVAIGEETGHLSGMMRKLAHYFELEIFFLFDNFIVIIEPIIILFLGSAVLFIMLSLFLPIYTVVSQATF